VEVFSLSPEWVTALATIILVLATCIYVYFSYKLTKETVKLREVETNPFLSLYFDTFFKSNKLKLIIKNIGKAPAYNLTFSMDKKFDKYFNYNFKNKISYFAPNQELKIASEYYEVFDKLDCKHIPIKIKYYSKDKVYIEDDFILEWKYLSETLIGTDNIEGIKQNLESIQKEINTLNKTIKNKGN